MKYITIKRKDGSVNTVRYQCEVASENPLTLQEEIIKELLEKIEFLENENMDLGLKIIGLEEFLESLKVK